MIWLGVAVAAGCFPGAGWLESPDGRCYRLTRPVSSLRACVAECGPAAPPVCITTEAEQSFVGFKVARMSAGHWTGMYQANTSDESTWSCVSGGNSTYAGAWAPGQPGLGEGLDLGQSPLSPPDREPGPGEDCVHLRVDGYGASRWYDGPCDSFGMWQQDCICATPSPEGDGPALLAYPAALETDLLTLEAAAWLAHASWTAEALARGEAELAALRATASGGIIAAFIIGLTPTLAILLWNAIRRHMSAEAKDRTAAALKLKAARRAASDIRLRISLSFFTVGWLLYCIGFIPFFAWSIFNHNTQAVLGPLNWWNCIWTLASPLIFLAVSPTDQRAINALCYFFMILCYLFAVLISFQAVVSVVFTGGDVTNAMSSFLMTISMVVGASLLVPTVFCECCCAGRTLTPRQKLERLWFFIRFVFFTFTIALLVGILGQVISRPYGQDAHNLVSFTAWLVSTMAMALLMTKKNRARALRAVGRIGKLGTKEQEAATVAALVGGGSAERALAEGAKRFRALPITELAEADLQTNTDGAVLHAKTVEAKLGDVESFISHSWSDDGGQKFGALQTWRAEVKHRTDGVEPLVWLDKACIDQANIDANIKTLPVFLSGCRTLLVLAGPTYATRLWCAAVCPRSPKIRPPHTHRPPCQRCVVELFTFLRMGGEPERIRVMELGGKNEDVRVALNRFDAAHAKCYREGDRQRLLAVVEAGFGDFAGFNKIVRGIFVDARTQNLEAQVAAQAAAVARLSSKSEMRPEDYDGPLSA